MRHHPLRIWVLCVLLAAVAHVACSGPDGPDVGGAARADVPSHDPQGAHAAEETEPHDEEVDPAAPVPTEDAAVDSGVDGAAADAGQPTPADAGAPTTPTPPKMPLLKAGLHPDASDALRVLGIGAGQIIQTIGSIAASAGTHEADGTVNGLPYSAATDISVKGMSDAQIRSFLTRMTAYGFAGWYRRPGFDGWPASEQPHMHVIFAGAPMKRLLRDQCRDFFVNKNGLVGHAVYTFLAWPLASRNEVKAIYAKHNPLAG